MSGSAVADIRDTYGTAFIGLIFSTVMYGITITQTWIYYCHYHARDTMVLKGYIAFLFVMDTLHTILCIYSLYWYLIPNFGNIPNLDLSVWSMSISAGVNALVGFLVQLFYARRVYIISKSIVVPLIIVILGGLCLSLSIALSAKLFVLKRLSHLNPLIWMISVGMSAAALADIMIALAMCWYLYRKRTGFSETDSIIMTLMTYSINSGLLTSVLATGVLVSFAAWRSSLLYTALFWLLGKCYVNSFLALLNNRDTLRERSNDGSSHAFDTPSIRPSKAYNIKCKTGPTAVAVTVHQAATTDFAASKHDYNEPEPEKSGGVSDTVAVLQD